ncbi:MAG: galactokinase family protein, partial [Actinomycetota bacterium]
MKRRTARAPGRVNLIGDHTDYSGGLALPAALPWATTVAWEELDDQVIVESTFNGIDHKASIGLDERATTEPSWLIIAQHIARLAGTGGHFTVTSDLPVGAGLSSSAAYTVAVALAVGLTGDQWSIARRCQEAEAAAGSSVGLLDQMASLAGQFGKAVLLDFTGELFELVQLPEGTEIVIVDSTERRSLANSAYSERRRDCEAVEGVIGPLASATLDQVKEVLDPLLRRRAHHVVSENLRVRAAVA